ncbi:MAG: hypothetical protein IPK72_12360 [Candidatus Eisenbacteria bacterium]|nr:hypothetical protein [Candidatus Eisenbacteria bacterium]
MTSDPLFTLRERLTTGEPVAALLSTLGPLAAARTTAADGRALLLVDGLGQVATLWKEGLPPVLLEAVLRALAGMPERPLEVGWLAEGQLGESAPLFTRALDDVLEAPSLREGCNQVARLLSLLRVTSYFDELLIEAIARDRSAGHVHALVGLAAFRAWAGRPWEQGRAALFVLIERLRTAGLPPLEWRPAGPPDLPFDRLVAALVRSDGDPLDGWRLAQAEYLLSAAPLKRREIAHSLREYWTECVGPETGRPAQSAPGPRPFPGEVVRAWLLARLEAIAAGDPGPLLVAAAAPFVGRHGGGEAVVRLLDGTAVAVGGEGLR